MRCPRSTLLSLVAYLVRKNMPGNQTDTQPRWIEGLGAFLGKGLEFALAPYSESVLSNKRWSGMQAGRQAVYRGPSPRLGWVRQGRERRAVKITGRSRREYTGNPCTVITPHRSQEEPKVPTQRGRKSAKAQGTIPSSVVGLRTFKHTHSHNTNQLTHTNKKGTATV